MATPPMSTRQLNSLQSAEGLQEYLLKGVKRSGRQLGNGAFGIVEELEVNGVVVAGKKIHETLVDPFNQGADIVGTQFVKECNIMSRLRHPHIVQFLGIYFQERAPFPVLVMEYLPHSLDELLEQRPNIATSVKVSFLYDVAKGLAYLHGQDPPIIHRDLTAMNILLNSAMVAKIADFGVARIVNLHGNQAASLTRVPGALVYMPPEAGQDAKYNTKLDIFSYGVVTLFTITQVFPKDLLPPTYLSSERPQALLARTEVERRECYYEVAYRLLDETNPAHKLVKLSEVCLCNHPAQRPTVDLLITVLQELHLHLRLTDPFLAKDKLELMDLARAAEERRWHMEDKHARELELEAKELELANLRQRERVLTVDVVRQEEQYEEARSELHRKTVQIQDLESQLKQRERDTAEIRRLQMMLEDLSAREATLQAELAKKEVKEELLKEELAREMSKQLVQAPTQRSQGDVNASVPKLVPNQSHSTAMAPGLYNKHRRPSGFDHHTACTAGYLTPRRVSLPPTLSSHLGIPAEHRIASLFQSPSGGSQQKTEYTAILYQPEYTHDLCRPWKAMFIVCLKNNSYSTALRKYRSSDFDEELHPSTPVGFCFLGDAVELDIPFHEAECQGYTIEVDASPCKIRRSDVNHPDFEATADDTYPPRIVLDIEPHNDTPNRRRLNCHLKLRGTEGPVCHTFSLKGPRLRALPSTDARGACGTDMPDVGHKGILNSKPELNDLMEIIAAAIPAKWEEVGYALRIEREHMERIKSETIRLSSTMASYREVFSYWLNHALEQCTWTAFLNALATRQVGEGQLARKIRQDLLKRGCN